MKALKDAAAKALEELESIGQESPVRDHQANGAIESAVRTLKAQMRATRFGLKSRGKVPMARRLRRESKAESGPEIHWSLVSASSRKRPRKENQELSREIGSRDSLKRGQVP